MRVILSGDDQVVSQVIRENRIRVNRGVISFTPEAEEDTKEVAVNDSKDVQQEDTKEVEKADEKEAPAVKTKRTKK